MLKKVIVTLLALLIVIAYEIYADDNCMKCHSSPTLSVIDTATGRIRSFHVDMEKFTTSNHGSLKCVDCHEEEFSKWPHTVELKSGFTCITCHGQQSEFLKLNPIHKAKFGRIPMGDIHSEFDKSVHAKALDDDFSCFSCHDPHEFKSREGNPEPKHIKSENAMCLNCHASEENFTFLTDRQYKTVETIHDWLPNAEIHWESVRCIDCHTSYEPPNRSHLILPANSAVKNCESCHSQNSILLTKLYKYEHKESRQKMGFFNGSLLNNAYVIGTTRNAFLDNLSIMIFVLMVGGLSAHGFLRWYFSSKRRTKK